VTVEKERASVSDDWGALAGLRVLDFTQSLAGPYATQILADLGADVLKIETVGVGDPTRAAGPWHPSDAGKRNGGYFHSVNRNKRSMALNLKDPEAREIIFELIQDYDIVVENFRAGVMEKLGLSYEELSARNVRIIYAALRGFGDPRTGESPYVAWPALDVVAQAMGGINAVTGSDPDTPSKVGPGIGDIVPGIFLALGTLAAVVSRNTTGKGQFLDVAMVDSILAITERIVYQRSFGKVIAKGTGNHQPFMAPFGLYPARDGHVALAASNQNFFEKMCRALGAEELLEDERFNLPDGRRANRSQLVREITARTAKLSKAELIERLGGKVPFGPVYTMAEIAEDPHFAARNMLPEVEIEGLSEPLSIAGQPVKMLGTPGGVYRAGPVLGADTDSVLRGLGRSEQQIAEMRARGAAG
jgi:crotonobetainyl-CoA:carnitine CoA-transferase CaiB-like acyl-CoA transferase